MIEVEGLLEDECAEEDTKEEETLVTPKTSIHALNGMSSYQTM